MRAIHQRPRAQCMMCATLGGYVGHKRECPTCALIAELLAGPSTGEARSTTTAPIEPSRLDDGGA